MALDRKSSLIFELQGISVANKPTGTWGRLACLKGAGKLAYQKLSFDGLYQLYQFPQELIRFPGTNKY